MEPTSIGPWSKRTMSYVPDLAFNSAAVKNVGPGNEVKKKAVSQYEIRSVPKVVPTQRNERMRPLY